MEGEGGKEVSKGNELNLRRDYACTILAALEVWVSFQ